MMYYLKKNGSKFNKTQPFFRCETTYMKAFKMNILPHYVSKICKYIFKLILFFFFRFIIPNTPKRGMRMLKTVIWWQLIRVKNHMVLFIWSTAKNSLSTHETMLKNTSNFIMTANIIDMAVPSPIAGMTLNLQERIQRGLILW